MVDGPSCVDDSYGMGRSENQRIVRRRKSLDETRSILVLALLALVVTVAACGETEVTREVPVTVVVTAIPEVPQAAAPRELTALVGAGRDTRGDPSLPPVNVDGTRR